MAEKPSYRGPWRNRRYALVPMLGFFEPDYETGKAVRWKIGRSDGLPFTMAAIWDCWRIPDGGDTLLHSFSLLTLNAGRSSRHGPLPRAGGRKALPRHHPGRIPRSLAASHPQRCPRVYQAHAAGRIHSGTRATADEEKPDSRLTNRESFWNDRFSFRSRYNIDPKATFTPSNEESQLPDGNHPFGNLVY